MSDATLSKEQIKRVQRSLSGVPKLKLARQSQTVDAQREWVKLNENAQLLGRCLGARFDGIDHRDPAHYLLASENEFSRLQHTVIWNQVSKYETLLSLIQLSWTDICSIFGEFEAIQDIYQPCSGFSLFLTVLMEGYNQAFTSVLEGCQVKSSLFESG